jgi:hypothetical protein
VATLVAPGFSPACAAPLCGSGATSVKLFETQHIIGRQWAVGSGQLATAESVEDALFVLRSLLVPNP